MMEGMQDKGKSLSGLAKKVSESCTKAALQHHIDGKDSAMYSIGKKVGVTITRPVNLTSVYSKLLARFHVERDLLNRHHGPII